MSGKRGGKRAGRGPGRPRNSDTSEEDYDSEVESSNWATEGDHHHQKLDKKFHEAKRMGLISSEEPSPQASDGDLDDNDTWVGSNNDGDGSSNDGDGSKNGGGSSTSDGSDSQDEQFSEDEPEGGQEEEEDVWAFYARIVKANCCLEETGLPPVLQTSRSSPGSWEGAIFVLPKDVQLTHMGKRKVKYNGAWVETGCACGPGDQTVYFCSCSAATANVKNILSLQTIATGGEEDHEGESSMPPANPVEQSCMLGSEQENCMHIQALQTIIDDGQFALRDIVNDLVFLAEERESEGDGEGGGDGGEGVSDKFVETLGKMPIRGNRGSVLVWQVGLYGALGMPAGIVIEKPDDNGSTSDYTCLMCKSKKCNHLTCLMKHLGNNTATMIDDEDSGPTLSSGPSRLLQKEAFEQSLKKLVHPPDEDEGLPTRLKIIGMSSQSIPLQPSKRVIDIKMLRQLGQWPASECHDDGILRLGHYEGNGRDIPVVQGAYVIGLGGVIPDVEIYNTSDGLRYDGGEDGLLRSAKANVLFTHEIFEEFLNQFCNNRISMKGWFKSKMRVFKAAAEEMLQRESPDGVVSSSESSEEEKALCEKAKSIIALLDRPSIANDFIDCVFDYIQLLAIDYDEAFKCDCPKGRNNLSRESLQHIYDNACNLLISILLRWPALLKRDRHVIDPLHYFSHTNCSPAYNGKIYDSLNEINTAINEQKNRVTNRARTSLSGMGQIRALTLMRHFLAMINTAQRAVNSMQASWRRIKQAASQTGFKTVVCDGSKTSFARKFCYMDRPWQQMPDNDSLPSALFRGAELDQAMMIHDSRLRSTLQMAMQKKSLSIDTWKILTKWIREERGCLEPYIKEYLKLVQDADDANIWKLERRVDSKFLPLLRHWASGAPEIVLLPVATFSAVCEIIETKKVSTASAKVVGLHSPLLQILIDLPLSNRFTGRERACVRRKVGVSPELTTLLQFCLKRAQNCLKACGGAGADCSAAQLHRKGASNPWQNSFQDSEDEFFRTGIWTSSEHPVIRTIPKMRHDLLAAQSKEQYRKKVRQEEREHLDKLVEECEILGSTCNKYKSKVRSLTPGLFTVYCGGCGICEYFELLEEAESPATVFRTFVHRAWTDPELEAYRKWKQGEGEWVDPFPCEFYDEVL